MHCGKPRATQEVISGGHKLLMHASCAKKIIAERIALQAATDKGSFSNHKDD